MGGGGGGDAGAEARAQEAARQARIKAATDEINNIFGNKVKKTRTVPNPNAINLGNFSGRLQPVVDSNSALHAVGKVANVDARPTIEEEYWELDPNAQTREQMYKDQRSAVYDLNKMEVDRQAGEIERQNRFGLARSGLLGGSANIDSMSEIGRRTNEGLMRAGGIADDASASLQNADEQTRNNLISLAQSGIDTSTAAQMASQGLKTNADNAASARSAATIGGLFDDLSQGYLTYQRNMGRQAGAAQGQQQFYGATSARTGGSQGR
jgi:hypothetical protein